MVALRHLDEPHLSGNRSERKRLDPTKEPRYGRIPQPTEPAEWGARPRYGDSNYKDDDSSLFVEPFSGYVRAPSERVRWNSLSQLEPRTKAHTQSPIHRNILQANLRSV